MLQTSHIRALSFNLFLHPDGAGCNGGSPNLVLSAGSIEPMTTPERVHISRTGPSRWLAGGTAVAVFGLATAAGAVLAASIAWRSPALLTSWSILWRLAGWAVAWLVAAYLSPVLACPAPSLGTRLPLTR